MKGMAVRLRPGDDLERALEAMAGDATFVVSGIGSLDPVALRYAGRKEVSVLQGAHEILTLAGSLSRDGAHLHMSVSNAEGRVLGGHVGTGCVVRTTAEVLLATLPDTTLAREHDPATGFRELVVRSTGEPT